MADEILKRDQNRVTVLAGVTNDSDLDIKMLRVDPITKRLLISAELTVFDARYLKLDQSTPQMITGGIPVFDAGWSTNADIDMGSNTLTTTGAGNFGTVVTGGLTVGYGISQGHAIFDTGLLTTSDRTYTFPDATGTIALSSDTTWLKINQTTPQTIINGMPLFNLGLGTPVIKPLADSTTAIQIMKADGTTPMVTFDTTNKVTNFFVLSTGSTPANSGAIRLSNAELITSRNATNSGNRTLLSLDASNIVQLAPASDISFGSGKMYFDYTNGRFSIGATTITKDFSFSNSAAKTFGIEASAETTVGRALTISAGSTVAGATVDVAGGNLILNSGLGKGTGASDIIFSTGRTLTTGSTLQTLTQGARLFGTGNFLIGSSTTDPGVHFQITGTGAYNAALAARFDLFNSTYGTSWFTHVGNTGVWQVANGSATRLQIAATANGQIDFYNGSGNVIFNGTGNVGIGVTPTAVIHLKAGTATASTAPLKFTSGTLLSSPEAGAVEFLTDKFYATQTTGATRKEIKLVDKYTAEMYQYENANVSNIYTQSSYHAINHFVTGTVSGFTFVAGILGSGLITDYSGTVAGTVKLNDTAHGLATGDYITINGTTDYQGIYQVTRIDADNFYFTKAYVSDQTGQWSMGSYLKCDTGSAGTYQVNMSMTAWTASANQTIKFEMAKNTTNLDNIAVSNKYGSTDYTNTGSVGMVTLADGDRLWLIGMNQTSAGNLTIRHANISLIRS